MWDGKFVNKVFHFDMSLPKTQLSNQKKANRRALVSRPYQVPTPQEISPTSKSQNPKLQL